MLIALEHCVTGDLVAVVLLAVCYYSVCASPDLSFDLHMGKVTSAKSVSPF